MLSHHLATALMLFYSGYASATQATCPPLQASQFADQCTRQFGGVVDGANCFYNPSGDTGATWSQANVLCNQQGGVLAQIHTDSEYTKISKFLTAKFGVIAGGALNVALQRDNDLSTGTCAYTQNSTYWYDNGVKNAGLSVGNTWMRTQTCKEAPKGCPGCNCFLLNTYVDGYFSAFGDYTCTGNAGSLCQFRGPNQNYTLTNTPCLAETPIETFTGNSPQQCADVCTQRIWCRSFNFGTYSSNCSTVCQLFSWSVNDTCTVMCQQTYTVSTTPFSSCNRFNYVP